MIGSVTEAWTNATISVLPIEVIIQEAPTDWISPPKFDARLAIHTARKIGLFSGERKVGRAGCGPGAESEEATGSPCDICIGGPRLAANRPAPECDPTRTGRPTLSSSLRSKTAAFPGQSREMNRSIASLNFSGWWRLAA